MTDFRISAEAVVHGNQPPDSARRASISSVEFEDLGELPRSYGRPFLFAIARDPHTLFAYWDIDWPQVFSSGLPSDHLVHLRVLLADGTQESSTSIEPLAANCYVPVSQARSSYRLEIGYYQPAEVWNSIATSDSVATPPDDVAADESVDVATIPFHLSFQRIVDFFRAAKYDGAALVRLLRDLQQRSDSGTESLTKTESEMLRGMGLSSSPTKALQRLRDTEQFLTRERTEAILGLGGSSYTQPPPR